MNEDNLLQATGVGEALRRLAAHTEKRKRENAHAAGFASLEEYEQDKLDRRRQQEMNEEESIKEHCLAMGIAREQYDLEREDFLLDQIERHPKPKEHNILPPMQDCNCDCEGHPIPFFCPKSLVQYKSQDFPDMIEYLGNRHYIDSEKVTIKKTDKSRRLDQELLERRWIRRPLDVPINDIPPWFKADGVVQQMIRQSAHQDTSISFSPSPGRTPSLLYDHPVSSSPSSDEAVTASMDTSVEIANADHNVVTPCFQEEPPLDILARDSNECGLQARADGLRKRRPKATTKTVYRRTGKGSRIAKVSWKPAMGLRSRNISRFYELG